MARPGLRRNKRGQFLILISLGIVIMIVTLSSILAYTALSPIHFEKTNFRETTTQLSINFRQALAIALADVSKELDRKASVSQYLKYTKLDEYPKAKEKGYESLTEWHKITLLRQSGLGLNLNISIPFFQCNWGSPQGYSRAEANMSLDILSYGFYGWKNKVKVELNLAILSLKDINESVTSFWFNLKREMGVPVSGLAASSVKVFFQGKKNMFNQTDPASIKLAYFGGGNYLLTCATRNMTYPPIVKMILQDPNGIVVGAYSPLAFGDDATGPKTKVSVSRYHVPRSGVKVITLNATVDDTTSVPWSNIVAVEYFLDVPGSNGNGTPMAPLDGVFDSPKEDVWAQINVTDWALGCRIIYIHGMDAKGNWGNFVNVTLKVVEKLAMHIKNMKMGEREIWYQGKYIRVVYVEVTIVDEEGYPVEGAEVLGSWEKSPIRDPYVISSTTNANGWAELWARKKSYSGLKTFTFEVTDVTKKDWVYDATSNEVPSSISKDFYY